MGSDVKHAVKKLEGDNIYETLDPSTTGYLEGAKQMYERVSQGDSSDWADPAAIKESFKGKGVDAQGNPEKYPVDYFANPITTNIGGDTMQVARAGGRIMAGYGAGVGVGAATGAGAGTTTAGSEGFTGGLSTGAESGASMGTGTGSSVPASGLRYAGSEQVLGQSAGAGAGSGATTGGLQVGPEAMASFNAGTNLSYANNSGIMSGGEGQTFSAPQSGAQQGNVNVGPDAAKQIGTQPTPQGPQAPSTTPPQTPPNPQGKGVVDQILSQMKANAVPLGIMGLGLAAAGQQRPMPSQEQMQGLSDEARQTANQLLSQYRSGTLSAGQAAQLEQLTRQTKNQITQYFASIGQADSTAHMQALAQVDAQGLQMKQQMLDSMLQQGMQAIGIAAGPLNNIAQYQLGQDQALRQAYGNFATAAGLMAGRSAGTPQPTAQPQPAPQQTSSLRAPENFPQSQQLG